MPLCLCPTFLPGNQDDADYEQRSSKDASGGYRFITGGILKADHFAQPDGKDDAPEPSGCVENVDFSRDFVETYGSAHQDGLGRDKDTSPE